MNYTSADFIRLMSEVEHQGGEHLEDICGGQEYEYVKPDGTSATCFTPGCENESVFHVAYDPYATVMVPEPVLEPDPTRDGRSKRAKTEPDPTDTTYEKENRKQRRRTVVRMRERVSEVDHADAGVLVAARVCAGHDNLGSWPRFRHVIEDGPQR